jgi:hypothetical protein
MARTAIQAIYAGLRSGDVELVKRLLTEHQELTDRKTVLGTWLHKAAEHGNVEMAAMLLGMGLDINSCTMPQEDTPLTSAIDAGHFGMVRYLLSHGADPKIGRPLIGATNREPEELALELVKLLVQHGAEINRVYPWYGDDKVVFSPLSWAVANDKATIVDYLRSQGATMPADRQVSPAPENLSQEVVAYFQEHFGPVQPLALIEIVPSEPPIAVHAILAEKGRDHITLFTTGLSEAAMSVPVGSEEYRFAELFIQLPAPWPLSKKALGDPKNAWPVHWLPSIAKYPHEHETWLGGPATIIANGDPPEPLAPNMKFTSMLLLAERDFTSRDGRTVQLYRLLPLYTEERNLEIKQGLAALMRALDHFSVPFIVDLKRKNVATSKKP